MGQFEVNFHPRTAIKGQALAEFTYSNAAKITGMANSIEAAKATKVREKKNSVPTEWDAELWTLYVDSASNDTGSKAGIMLINPEGHKIHCAIRFGFKALNNKALIAGLHLAREMEVRNVKFFNDS